MMGGTAPAAKLEIGNRESERGPNFGSRRTQGRMKEQSSRIHYHTSVLKSNLVCYFFALSLVEMKEAIAVFYHCSVGQFPKLDNARHEEARKLPTKTFHF